MTDSEVILPGLPAIILPGYSSDSVGYWNREAYDLVRFQLLVFRKQVAVNSDTLCEMQESRLAQERPQVIVLAKYRQRRVIEVVVRNIGRGAAKDITFEFSAPRESSISDQEHPEVIPRNELPYFQEGLNFLAPGAEIGVIWDTHENLLPLLRERGLENGITATSRYGSLTGDQYETSWVINPLLIAAERYASELDRDSEWSPPSFVDSTWEPTPKRV